MEKEKEKSECPGKGLGLFSTQEEILPTLASYHQDAGSYYNFRHFFSTYHSMCNFDLLKSIVSIMKSMEHEV